MASDPEIAELEKKQEDEDAKQMMEEFETHMKDFEPADMLTIELPPGEEMTLHEDQRDE